MFLSLFHTLVAPPGGKHVESIMAAKDSFNFMRKSLIYTKVDMGAQNIRTVRTRAVRDVFFSFVPLTKMSK